MGKRAELMCHTKMDPYFGLCTADELIRKAKKLSMSAVAITDADSPEAFPEAYYWWDRIKKEFPEDDVPELIYGIKTLIWDDEGFVVRNKTEKNLDTEYVNKQTYRREEVLDEIFDLQKEIVNYTFQQDFPDLEELKLFDVGNYLSSVNEGY